MVLTGTDYSRPGITSPATTAELLPWTNKALEAAGSKKQGQKSAAPRKTALSTFIAEWMHFISL